jgi:hypothetical protein
MLAVAGVSYVSLYQIRVTLESYGIDVTASSEIRLRYSSSHGVSEGKES